MCKNYNFDTYGDGVDNEIYFMDKVCNKKVKKKLKKTSYKIYGDFQHCNSHKKHVNLNKEKHLSKNHKGFH